MFNNIDTTLTSLTLILTYKTIYLLCNVRNGFRKVIKDAERLRSAMKYFTELGELFCIK